jgi:hypothetical protein
MDFLRLKESITVDIGERADEIKEKVLKVAESKNHVIIPKIEAIHAAVTRNNVFYPKSRLQGKQDFVCNEKLRPTGVYSWTMPYNKPMLVNHDIDVSPLGRITKAEFKNKTSTGIPGIIVMPEITDPDAIAKVVDGRYSTVSIGADTDSATCSICGKDQLVEWCDHRRGQIYDKKLCFWSAGNLWFIELSFVNAPADEHAGIKEIPEMTESVESAIQMGLFLQDIKENKLYDLTKDKVYVPTSKGLVQIPESEFIKEYYYIPFNVKLEESAPEVENNKEAKAGKPVGKMKTDTTKQLLCGHSLVHGYLRKGNTKWTRDQIIAEHTRLMRIMKSRGVKHIMQDSLDDTLPGDLKSWSKENK